MRLPRDERGLTLTELTIVGVLAVLVMLSLTGFYFNSQRTWLEGSSQALTQREATLVVEHLARRIHEASSASSSASGTHHTLTLYDEGDIQTWQYRLDPSDSLLHEYQSDTMEDRGPVVSSRLSRFQAETSTTSVGLTLLELRSGTGDRVLVASRFALYNR